MGKKHKQTAANKQLQDALAQTTPKKSWNQHSKVAPKEERTGQDGFVYDSKTEYQRYCHLNLLERAGKIKNLQRQVSYELSNDYDGDGGRDGMRVSIMVGPKRDKIAVYTPDFVYDVPELVDNSHGGGKIIHHRVVEDVKGYRDEGSKFRIRVFESLYQQNVTIVMKDPKTKAWITEK